jgi:hypothetical protein
MSVTEDKILVSNSLQETLWRLEEVRQGFRKSPIHKRTYRRNAPNWMFDMKREIAFDSF